MGAPRIRRVQNKQEMENLIDDFMTQGYEIVNQGEASVLLRRKTWGSAGGHVLVGLLTVWFTLGLGNLAYAFIAHNNAEKIMLKLERSST